MTNTTTQQLFNAIIDCNPSGVQSLLNTHAPFERTVLVNNRLNHLDLTPIFVACGLWRKAKTEKNSDLVSKYTTIVEALVDAGCSLTTPVQRKLNRITKSLDSATGVTLAQEFGRNLPQCIVIEMELSTRVRQSGKDAEALIAGIIEEAEEDFYA